MRIIFLITIIGFLSCNSADKKKAQETPVTNINGEELMKNNCGSCHRCYGDFTGPALKGALERWGDKTLMYEFIKNPFGVIQKNEYARDLQKKYQGAIMTPSTLNDKELDAIFDYCNKADPPPENMDRAK